MKSLSLSLISSLALTAVASPVPDSMRPYLANRQSVTSEEVSKLDFYAEYAGASYCNSEAPVGSKVTCAENVCPDVAAAGAVIDATFVGKVTDIQGFLSTDPKNKVIVLSFRGSHSIRNWITNFVFLQEPCDLVGDCLLHAGFAGAYKEVAGPINTALAAAAKANPDYKIVFTGHSLGAAIATVAAAYQRAAGHAVDLYTYGSPRVGNRAFVDFVTKQPGLEYRVTHLADPVPRLPPIFANYRHTSPEYWLSTGTSDTVNYTAADIKVCEGYANLKCNSGQLGLDIDAHGHYFGNIATCGPDGTPFKRRATDAAALDGPTASDPELEAKVNDYVQKDIKVAATLDDVWG
ncbi:triacylglycerol lipase precursor [Apiospora arundinis]|uniref:Triacylglycerol lipase n=1 Tax=Apiospora arundinis TaxID=335852 RepID=A0ABR2HZG7_9PEZI